VRFVHDTARYRAYAAPFVMRQATFKAVVTAVRVVRLGYDIKARRRDLILAADVIAS